MYTGLNMRFIRILRARRFPAATTNVNAITFAYPRYRLRQRPVQTGAFYVRVFGEIRTGPENGRLFYKNIGSAVCGSGTVLRFLWPGVGVDGFAWCSDKRPANGFWGQFSGCKRIKRLTPSTNVTPLRGQR